ncbi:hypothetical protein Slin15195_G072250 [Septoria linicola]|uniref:Uncharacterized protein n=1 Tax=Septoria linicola TaxID=215465 RepID=A0A9Q9B079_9PEZI|nr:hypothetical protein Slin15195_G072250 [Septoria linicola]
MQMLSDFLESNFPSTRARAGLADRGSYLATLPDIEIATTPMLKTAIDTLCFAHIGAKTGDRRLVQRSQTSYGQVLSSLITAVNRRSGDISYIEPRAVITSIMLLCLYDDSIPLPFQGENGWATHYWGCQQLLGAHGPGFMRIDDPFDRMLFNSLRMPCFFLGVAKRKSIAQGQPEWLQLSEDMDPTGGAFTGFYRVAMRMPAILERIDDVLEGHLSHNIVQKLCVEIQSFRLEMVQWHAGLVENSKNPHWELPKVVDIADLSSASTNAEHLYMRRSKTFTKIFEFGLPKKVVQNHTLCAMSCIVMDCSLLRLLHFIPGCATYLLPDRLEDIEQRAFSQSTILCRSLYHYTSFDGLAYADFSEFINDIALNFFEEYGAVKEMQWCLGVRAATTVRRQRIKENVQPRTLCRMGDAGPGFAMACRYRAPMLKS